MSDSTSFVGWLRMVKFDLFIALWVTWLPTCLLKLPPSQKSNILLLNSDSVMLKGSVGITTVMKSGSTTQHHYNMASCVVWNLAFIIWSFSFLILPCSIAFLDVITMNPSPYCIFPTVIHSDILISLFFSSDVVLIWVQPLRYDIFIYCTCHT